MFFYFMRCASVVFFLSYNNSFFLRTIPNGGLLWDGISIPLILMRGFILYVSYFLMKGRGLEVGLIGTLLLSAILVFSSNNILVIFFAFETSLIPISYIILKWGTYPDRSWGVILLFSYTLFFSLPFLYLLLEIYDIHGSLDLSVLREAKLNRFNSYLVFFMFAVKLPAYGLHLWLPVAHVEAPTYGSMILAAVLLKMGGVGLMRTAEMINMDVLRNSVFIYFLFSYLFVSFVTLFQRDFKKVVAYSSVFHMGSIPLLFMSGSDVADSAIVAIIVFHGLVSPLLFLLVGKVYEISETRTLSILGGFAINLPILTFFAALSFVMTLPAPPFMTFLGEMLFFYAMGEYPLSVLVILGGGAFMALLYNFTWFTPMISKRGGRKGVVIDFNTSAIFTLTFTFSFLFMAVNFIF